MADDMVVDMEVDKVAGMEVDKKRDKNWPTWSWTWVADTKVKRWPTWWPKK